MPNPAEWIGACAAVVTAASALAAVGYGILQYRSHEKARRDAWRPHVVVDLVPSPSAYGFADLVVSNIGASTATDVRIGFEPEPRTVFDEIRGRGLTDTPLIISGIPSLSPGREIRTTFERLIGRAERTDLPMQYRVEASYDGEFGPFLKEEHILDIELLLDIVHAKIKRPLESTLEAIKKDLDSIAESLADAKPDQS